MTEYKGYWENGIYDLTRRVNKRYDRIGHLGMILVGIGLPMGFGVGMGHMNSRLEPWQIEYLRILENVCITTLSSGIVLLGLSLCKKDKPLEKLVQ